MTLLVSLCVSLAYDRDVLAYVLLFVALLAILRLCCFWLVIVLVVV